MERIDKALRNEKNELDKIEVPEELEDRLRTALTKREKKRRKPANGMIAAILIGMILLTTYNYQAIAFYGKKILGFDQVVSGTLADLNELGKGQEIGESYQFSNGVEVILDGVMLDDNQLVAFYTIKDPSGSEDSIIHLSSRSFSGTFGRYEPISGQGHINDENTEIKWISSFEAPRAFERTLSFNFGLHNDGQWETGEISFRLDKNKAMGHTVRQKINQSINTDSGSIYFDSITASPTVTKIEGTFETIGELLRARVTGKGEYSYPKLELELIADGKRLENVGVGMGRSMDGGTFEARFEGLTEAVSSLEVRLLEYMASEQIDKTVQLKVEIDEIVLDVENHKIVISEVNIDSEKTHITITSEMNVTLDEVHLLANGEPVPLANVINEDFNKSEKDGAITIKRKLIFDTPKTEDLQLKIERVSYPKYYDQTIEIPVK